jgi:hypothetical protein
LNNTSNLYDCCGRCNSILGPRVFDSIEAKREYVRAWLINHGEWVQPITETMEVAE